MFQADQADSVIRQSPCLWFQLNNARHLVIKTSGMFQADQVYIVIRQSPCLWFRLSNMLHLAIKTSEMFQADISDKTAIPAA